MRFAAGSAPKGADLFLWEIRDGQSFSGPDTAAGVQEEWVKLFEKRQH